MTTTNDKVLNVCVSSDLWSRNYCTSLTNWSPKVIINTPCHWLGLTSSHLVPLLQKGYGFSLIRFKSIRHKFSHKFRKETGNYRFTGEVVDERNKIGCDVGETNTSEILNGWKIDFVNDQVSGASTYRTCVCLLESSCIFVYAFPFHYSTYYCLRYFFLLSLTLLFLLSSLVPSILDAHSSTHTSFPFTSPLRPPASGSHLVRLQAN